MRNREPNSNKKGSKEMGALISWIVALVLLDPTAGLAQEQRIRVGYSAISGTMSWVWAAKEGGYLDRHGIKVDVIYIGGSAQLSQATLAGDIAMGVSGGPSIVHVNLQRRSLIAFAGTLNRMVMKVMGTPQLRGPADLRGKRIAITRFGTVTDFSARLFLKKWGLSPEKDTAILQVGSIPNVLAALQSGASEAGVLSPPAHLQAEKLGLAELMDLSKEEIYYPFTYIVATPEFLERNPKAVMAFLMGTVEGIQRFKTDKPFAKKIMAKYLGVHDDAVFEESHQLVAPLFEKAPYVKREGLAGLVQILAEKDPKVNSLKLDTIIEDRFVRELETSGFIGKVYR